MISEAIDEIGIKFQTHNLFPFKIGDSKPMTELESIVVTINGTGWGQATMANVWARMDLDGMKNIAFAIKRLLLGISFSHPLALWHAVCDELFSWANERVTREGVQVVFSAFDAAIWDFYSREIGIHPCQALSPELLGDELLEFYGGQGFEKVLLPEPREELELIYTHGADGELFPAADNSGGLTSFLERERRKTVKVKCTGDVGTDFRELCAVSHIIDRDCRIWLDYNGSAKAVSDVVKLINTIVEFAPKVSAAVMAIEQPMPPAKTFLSNDVFEISQKGFLVFLDESALGPESIAPAKALGYAGVVGKTGKGFSAMLEMAREAAIQSFLFSMQDLTNIGCSFWQSMGAAAYIKNLFLGLVEGNQSQFLMQPDPIVSVDKGYIKTGHLIGPGWCS